MITGQHLGGSYIRVENYEGNNYDITGSLTPSSTDLIHEFGHYRQSQIYGDLSIVLAINSAFHPSESKDKWAWYEKDAQKQVLYKLALKESNYTNAYARNLLIIADSMHYNEPIILPHEQPQKMKKPTKKVVLDENVLKVYPNPAQNYFTIEYKLNETAGSAVIEMLDPTGKKLKILPIYDKQNQIVIETKDLLAGIYYIRLIIDGATSKIQKISVIK